MKETGKILSIKGEKAIVAVNQHSGCESCKICMFGKKGEGRITVINEINAKVGDCVTIELASQDSLSAILFALVPPLFLMIVGLIVAKSVNLGELWMFLVAFAGLVLGFFVSSFIDSKLKYHPEFKAKIAFLDAEPSEVESPNGSEALEVESPNKSEALEVEATEKEGEGSLNTQIGEKQCQYKHP